MRYTTRNARLLARWTAVAAGLTLLVSCDSTAPLPAGAKPGGPGRDYTGWWSIVEGCSGRTRPMSEIAWYVVPGWSFTSSGNEVAGVYLDSRSTIVLAEEVVQMGPAVRHEMLHALLRQKKGELEHPAEYFLNRCAAFVECGPQCEATSGARHAP